METRGTRMVISLLLINNFECCGKVAIVSIDGGCWFGDGNHVNVALDAIVVTIFSTTWVWAHLWVGTSSGTFGKFILVMNSKCIATCQLIGIRMVSGDYVF